MSTQFSVCINNSGYEASLELRKLYEILPDSVAKAHHQVRVVDESGEDYLYPEAFFVSVPLSKQLAERVSRIA